MGQGLRSTSKARLLDADNPGLNYMLANEAFFTKADFAAATRYALRALAAKPTYAEAQQFIPFYMRCLAIWTGRWSIFAMPSPLTR